MLEYLAVCQLTQGLKGPILCLVGAPGVGKTSIGRSVAKTLARKFHRYNMEYGVWGMGYGVLIVQDFPGWSVRPVRYSRAQVRARCVYGFSDFPALLSSPFFSSSSPSLVPLLSLSLSD